MTKRKKLILVGLAYFANILIFGIIYWFCWFKNPSNFILNSEYNEQTIKPFFFHKDLDTLNKKHKYFSATETNELIQPYFDTLKILGYSLKYLDNKLDSLKKLDSILSEKQAKLTDNNFGNYVTSRIQKFTLKSDSIKKLLYLADLDQKQTNKQTSQYFTNEVVIANIKYQLSLVELDLNKEKLDAYNKGLKSYSSFQDDSLAFIANDLIKEIDLLEKDRNSKLERISNLTESIRNYVVDFYLGQADKVGFFDFIYFSVITATSTGYGDILPNSTTIRILVSTEIFLSLFLFGFFFYFIAKPESK